MRVSTRREREGEGGEGEYLEACVAAVCGGHHLACSAGSVCVARELELLNELDGETDRIRVVLAATRRREWRRDAGLGCEGREPPSAGRLVRTHGSDRRLDSG